MGVFEDGAKGGLMKVNGDLEEEMDGTTTFEEKSSNLRGCHIKNNLASEAQVIAKGVVDISFASTSSAMQKEGLPC